MFVENWMTSDPVTLPPTATISEAAMEMGRHKFRHILVATPLPYGKRLVGIVSKYDIARAFPSDLNPFSLAVSQASVPQLISTIMSSPVITVPPSCDIEQAARLLRKHHFNALPVVRNNRLVGIITESDVFDALLEITGANAGGIKIMVECPIDSNPPLLLSQLSLRHNLHIQGFASFANKPSAKAYSVVRFTGRPPADFVDALYKLGFRVLTIG
jgi:acetoin utilization protein AcuB